MTQLAVIAAFASYAPSSAFAQSPAEVSPQTAPASTASAPPPDWESPPSGQASAARSPSAQGGVAIVPPALTSAPPSVSRVVAAPVSADAPLPPPAPPVLPAVHVGVRLRVALKFQNPGKPARLDDQSMNAYGELRLGGTVVPKVSYALNFNATGLVASGSDVSGTAATSGRAGILDAIVGLDFLPEFHLWAGQMVVPVDRSNFSGPFFIIPWNYPGLAGVTAGPREGPSGRNVGTTAWGDVGHGSFKYYAGIFGLDNAKQRPLYTGSLRFAALGKEPGYYNRSTYLGTQNVLALGLGAQYQNDGITTDTGASDYSELNADVLGELQLGSSVLTAEGAAYGFLGQGAYDSSFFGLAAFLTPELGFARVQPVIRYQQAQGQDGRDWVVDASLNVVVSGVAFRGTAGFQHADLGNIPSNMIQIGLQTIQL